MNTVSNTLQVTGWIIIIILHLGLQVHCSSGLNEHLHNPIMPLITGSIEWGESILCVCVCVCVCMCECVGEVVSRQKSVMWRFLSHAEIRGFLGVLRQNRGKWKGWQPLGIEPRTPICLLQAVLCHDNRTTTSLHNPPCTAQVVLKRLSHTPGSHSVCTAS